MPIEDQERSLDIKPMQREHDKQLIIIIKNYADISQNKKHMFSHIYTQKQ